MPAKTEKQRRFFAIALSIKQGKTPQKYSKKAAELAKSLAEKTLKEFVKK